MSGSEIDGTNIGREQQNQEALRSIGADSAYFFLFDGWQNELRGNRWHWIKRWSQYLPVVLVQTLSQKKRHELDIVAEPRLPNVSIAYVNDPAQAEPVSGVRCAGVIRMLQRQLGHHAPLLWMYNPSYLIPFALVPARARVYHATENYFNFTYPLSESFLRRVRVACTIGDIAFAVSEGVAGSLRREAGQARVSVITNGCDTAAYVGGHPDSRLSDVGRRFSATAVYAGNINVRLDFALLAAAADLCPDILIALYGPVAGLSDADDKQWRGLLSRSNVRHFGPVDADELPDIYAAADLGIIPYRTESYLVDNGFPLKTLEMAAAGLPVVSSYMRHIEGLATAISVARSEREFLDAVRCARRGRLTGQERAQLRALAGEHDYDRKFATALSEIRATVAHGGLSTRIDALSTAGILDIVDVVTQLGPIQLGKARLTGLLMSTYRAWAPRWIAQAIPRTLKDKIIARLGI